MSSTKNSNRYFYSNVDVKQIKRVQKLAHVYKENVCNKSFTFVYKNPWKANLEHMKVDFTAKNFLHLVGLNSE